MTEGLFAKGKEAAVVAGGVLQNPHVSPMEDPFGVLGTLRKQPGFVLPPLFLQAFHSSTLDIFFREVIFARPPMQHFPRFIIQVSRFSVLNISVML